MRNRQDSIFMDSDRFTYESVAIQREMDQLIVEINKHSLSPVKMTDWLNQSSELRKRVSQLTSLIAVLRSTNDSQSYEIYGSACKQSFNHLLYLLQTKVAAAEESTFRDLLKHEGTRHYAYILQRWHDQRVLHQREQELIKDLSSDGLDAWGNFYQKVVARMKFCVNDQEFSYAQALSFRSSSDAHLRKRSFYALEEGWREQEDIIAQIYNRITGYSIKKNNQTGYSTRLEESLDQNRIKRETIEAMWQAVDSYIPLFRDYLNEKADLLGKERLPYYDFWAPLSTSKRNYTYSEGVSFVLRHFGRANSSLKTFAELAVKESWIDEQDREEKRSYAFCAGFPMTNESRISMTYKGTMSDVLVLAHELGHAFHNHQLSGVEGLNQMYPLTLAETSSTFAELSVLEGAMDEAHSEEEQLYLLDEKLKRSVMNFMNIRSRFLFEHSFEKERRAGVVSVERTNVLMKEAWERSYQGSVVDPPAQFWTGIPHFYLPHAPYYNYPYTFGYLFALSLMAKRREKGESFEDDYELLLRNSGCMSVEDIAHTYLHEDITEPGFWIKGLELCASDVRKFIALSTTQKEVYK
ncbi:pantothenate kinase [Halobacillus locisalis]|uniref:Pantothenate kinase n=1 Tax=Halobacillus locisalis TaxID=220753 RepID=A0A838CPM1_9BACI|nr:M3 family metallopeptidase [Halobacillus locisalis]MBA2173789.1 pantothenate kinase [Halobacillus locisalis]